MQTPRYIEAVGRRKTSTARVRITPATKREVVVNGKSVKEYFPTATTQNAVIAPLNVDELQQPFTVTVHVNGGGIASQSEAVRHGIARALVMAEATLRPTLKHAGFLKRDPRMKERRKFGLRKARRAPQWSKR